MNGLAKALTVLAVAFAVTGDFYLKRYGDSRSWRDLAACLTLWEACAVSWVFVYRQNVPLGRSTIFGAAISVTANVLVGVSAFSESMRPAQWAGFACVLAGILLVG
jgi:multidrug transporter EmrE-like cation transporter